MKTLLTPATITTTAGALLAVGVGVAAAAGWLHLQAGLDTILIGAGLGALLGHNPTVPTA